MKTLHQSPFATDPRDVAERTVDLVNVFRLSRNRAASRAGAETIVEVLIRHGEQAASGFDVSGGLDDITMQRCQEVLAEVAGVFELGKVDPAADALNILLQRYCSIPRLVRHEGWPWHLHVDEDDNGPWHRWIGASSAFALACLLAGRDTVPWGVCAAAGCERVFVHDDRGGRRNHCSVTCGTRTRVARHRRQAE